MTTEEKRLMEELIYKMLPSKRDGNAIGYTKRMKEHDRKLEIAKKVALILSENRAKVEDLRDIFSLAQKQLSVSILPDSEQSQRFADTL